MELASRFLQNVGKKIKQRFVGTTIDGRRVDCNLQSSGMHTKHAGDSCAGAHVNKQHRIGSALTCPRLRADQRARIGCLCRRSRLAIAPAFK
jgi:hypothetical protein